MTAALVEGRDQLVDRGRREAFREHGGLGEREKFLARFAAFSWLLLRDRQTAPPVQPVTEECGESVQKRSLSTLTH
jgi:hypothetical protein